MQPIVGITIHTKCAEKNYCEVPLLAQNEQGFKNLLKLSSNAYINRLENKSVGVPLHDIYNNNSGLIMFVGGQDSYQYSLFKENKLEEISQSVNKPRKFLVTAYILKLSVAK